MNVENSRGWSMTSDSSRMLTTPWPSGVVRRRSPTSNSGSPKKASTPSCSRTMIERSSTPTDALDIPPYSSRIGLPSSDARNLRVVARSVRSSSGRWLSSQYLKTSDRIEVWVSLRSRTLPSSSGPNEWTLARTWAPSCPDSDRNSTGWPAGANVQSSDATRSMTSGFAGSPGAAIPVRSPLMSEMNTGTPAFDSSPARSWRVLVLPVPVAPAISPWRLSIESATWTRTSCRARPPASGCRSRSPAGQRVARGHLVAERVVHELPMGRIAWASERTISQRCRPRPVGDSSLFVWLIKSRRMSVAPSDLLTTCGRF